MIIATGVAHLEPKWNFSISNGSVQLNLQWNNANTGNLITKPPKIVIDQSKAYRDMPASKNMQDAHYQATSTVYPSSVGAKSSPYYSTSLRQSKFRSYSKRHTPPRYQAKSEYDPCSARTAENSKCFSSSNVVLSGDTGNTNVKLSDIENSVQLNTYSSENTNNHSFNSPGHSELSNQNNDGQTNYQISTDLSANVNDTSFTSTIHSDLSDNVHDGVDIVMDNDSQSKFISDSESTSSNTSTCFLSNTLCDIVVV